MFESYTLQLYICFFIKFYWRIPPCVVGCAFAGDGTMFSWGFNACIQFTDFLIENSAINPFHFTVNLCFWTCCLSFLVLYHLNSKRVCCKFNRRSGSKESRGLHRIQTCEVPVLNWNMDGQLGRDQGASYPAPIVFPEEPNGKALKVIIPM